MRTWHKEQILIVDDKETNLKLMDSMLRAGGYDELHLLKDPRRVIEVYKEIHPDLILLDIHMPHLDGHEIIRQLKGLKDDLLPPIIILTAQRRREHLVRALRSGARDFISKPFDINELLMRVRNLLDAHIAHKLLHDNKTVLENMVRRRTEELHRTQLQIVQKLGKAAEYKDEETGNHILRMSHISELLAKGIGWCEEDCELILYASPMHDIGKIGIPDSILCKSGRLDVHEWEIMKTHIDIGMKLLEGDDSRLLQMAREIVISHHEKWDGSGYPNGLAGDEIPLAGRIVALADVFDALTSERPYKTSWSFEKAVSYIKNRSGQHFDPNLVDTFVKKLPDVMEICKRYADPGASYGRYKNDTLSQAD